MQQSLCFITRLERSFPNLKICYNRHNKQNIVRQHNNFVRMRWQPGVPNLWFLLGQNIGIGKYRMLAWWYNKWLTKRLNAWWCRYDALLNNFGGKWVDVWLNICCRYHLITSWILFWIPWGNRINCKSLPFRSSWCHFFVAFVLSVAFFQTFFFDTYIHSHCLC